MKPTGWEIEHGTSRTGPLVAWNSEFWNVHHCYRARPHQPKMKKVKMLCFYNGKNLFWAESGEGYAYRCRVPSEDKEIEVPE